jgi:hypothetical protein
MNIEPYIAQLLYRYQCVTVPGFGAFLTEIQSAKWVDSANSFFPPKKMISFNTNLKNNDGLLANHIAQAEKTSYDYAVSAIQYEVLNWRKALELNGSLSIKNIGDISLNADNNIVFNPLEQTNYLSSSFGLSAFISPIIKRELFEQKIEALKDNTVINLETEEKSGRSYLKYAAIFVLGLSLIGSVSYSAYEIQIANETILIEQAVQKQVNNKIQEATFFIKSPMPAVTLSIKESKMSYHIMAGAFREEENADKILNRLSNLGYKARRIAANKYGLYPVLYASYATYEEAVEAKNEIQKTDNPKAWLLIESL